MSSSPESPQFLKPSEFRARYKISPSKYYKLLKSGRVPYVLLDGKTFRIPLDRLPEFERGEVPYAK